MEAKTSAAKARMLTAMMRDDVFTIVAAEKVADVGHKTHYDWLKKDPAYAEAVADAEELITQRLEQKAGERAMGINVKSPSDILMMFLLNGRRPERYKQQHQHKLTGEIAASLKGPTIESLKELTKEELKQLIEKTA